MGDGVLAVTQRWQRGRKRFTDVSFSGLLSEPEWTAERRRAVVHEWSHIYCRHRGDLFILWKEGFHATPIECFANDIQERECEYISAYILVRLAALRGMRGESSEYIARQIDVPSHLVELRWWILGRFGR